MQIINTPGVYTIGESFYHADPCPQPSLSASFAKKMMMQSPLHAMLSHPRLNPDAQHNPSKAMDFGSVCHDLLLQGGRHVKVLPFDNYRTKEAQAARDAAYEENLNPILQKDFERAEHVVAAAQEQIKTHLDAHDGFAGATEQTLVWQEDNGVWCRARLDGFSNQWVDDYKTTEGSASPDAWQRQLFTMGYDIQAAFYLRGCRKLGFNQIGGFRFFVQEVKEEPYALSVLALDNYAMDRANEKIDEAVELFGECLGKNFWPCYPAKTCWVEMPVFAEKSWNDRQLRKEIARTEGRRLVDTLNRPYATNAHDDWLEEVLGR